MKNKSTRKARGRELGGLPPGCSELFIRAPVQRAMLRMLYRSSLRGIDVAITRLHSHCWDETRVFREQQQYVGGIISVINRKIAPHGLVIKLGKTRRTYRLYRR